MREWSYYNLPLKVFPQRNFVADFVPLQLNFIFLNRFLSHPSIARWKAVVDFLFVIIELISLSLMTKKVISANLSKSAFFERGVSL